MSEHKHQFINGESTGLVGKVCVNCFLTEEEIKQETARNCVHQFTRSAGSTIQICDRCGRTPDEIEKLVSDHLKRQLADRDRKAAYEEFKKSSAELRGVPDRPLFQRRSKVLEDAALMKEKITILEELVGEVIGLSKKKDTFHIAYETKWERVEELLDDLSPSLRQALVPGTRLRRITAYTDRIDGRRREVWFELEEKT